MLRAVLFDFNGVLVDDEPIHTEVIEKVLTEEGVEWNRAVYEEQLVGMPDREVLQWALQRAGQSTEVPYLMRLLARKRAYYQDAIHRSGYPFFPGVVELIQQLAEEKIAMGVVSGAQRNEIANAIDQAGLAGCLKTIVSADDVERGKPEPEGYLKGLTGLNTAPPLPERLLHPHETLAVEDSQVGVQAARSAGLSTLAVTTSFSAAQLAESDRVVERLHGMSIDEILLRS